MMKGNPQGGSVASSTLAYPGNSFKYSPKFPIDEPQQTLNVFDLTVPTLQRGSASTTSSGSLQRQGRLPSQKCDEIYSLSEEDALGSGGRNQNQLQTEKVIVQVLQKVEKRHSGDWTFLQWTHWGSKKNGPKKYKNKWLSASEKC